ncbi:MAG: hypothetical protein QOC61_1104, partial [Acidobacteriota bacterium]|nr:hypothetical protein [Acidobacteriota bacterium]
PGGNHGSFFRISTHSTLMLAGGERTLIPRGLSIEEPYDSLSLMPTLLALTRQIDVETPQVGDGPGLITAGTREFGAGARPIPILWRQGFRPFPGRVIKELFQTTDTSAPVANSINTSLEAKP